MGPKNTTEHNAPGSIIAMVCAHQKQNEYLHCVVALDYLQNVFCGSRVNKNIA